MDKFLMTWIKMELHYFWDEILFFPDKLKHFLVYFIQFGKEPNFIISEIVDEIEFASFSHL